MKLLDADPEALVNAATAGDLAKVWLRVEGWGLRVKG